MRDMETIDTARLVLRRFVATDAAAMHAVLADPEAMRFWSTRPHASLAESEAWVAGTMASVAAGRADEFAVLLDGRLIGKVGLWQADEIGLIFAPEVWGRGFAREAAAALLARADAAGRPRVTADVDPGNARVLRLLTGLGFTETGRAARTFCLDDQWADSIYLARLAGRTAAAAGDAPLP